MFWKAYDLLLLFLHKSSFFILGVAHTDTFLCNFGPKMAIFRGFTNFRQIYWIAIKNINIKHHS